MSDWREQEVGNATRSREINEWIDESNESDDATSNRFVCECSDGSLGFLRGSRTRRILGGLRAGA